MIVQLVLPDPLYVTRCKYGNAVFFDFAGQHEYHGPHEMFMESIFNQRGSTVTIIVVVKATEEESVITQQLKHWPKQVHVFKGIVF